ncbi:DUF7260 family protein [Salinigranum halophilum]|uniref:DUF7260 family protein n=1 Tax=Salinigranum halophilum TaxID=2565931 RepID=UPI0010A868DE|nr:hypothetical protein [Salinigranum halophilum]
MSHGEKTFHTASALKRVRNELRFIRAEMEAFAEFERRVRDVPVSPNPSPQGQAGRVQTVQLRSTPRTAHRLAQAYQSTVMSTPHYESEYGDSYDESVRVEFDETTVQVLTGDLPYTSLAKKRVLRACAHSRKTRSTFFERVDGERDELVQSLSGLERWLDTIERVAERAQSRDGEGVVGAHDDLSRIRTKCDKLASARQESLRRDRQAPLTVDGSTRLTQFLYRSEPFSNPILSDIGYVGTRLEEARERLL